MRGRNNKLVLSPDAATHLEFLHLPLKFESGTHSNAFAQKNNKTLGQTLAHRRYAGLADVVLPKYASFLTVQLGTFLYGLKRDGDEDYRRFLNRYGDLTYSRFEIATEASLNGKGVYAYCVGDELSYIGRCKDSMRKRVNQGYGKIHPKNCYLDGQATNCHLNALITQTRGDISLWLFPLTADQEIEALERQLLRRYCPPWNIQRL